MRPVTVEVITKNLLTQGTDYTVTVHARDIGATPAQDSAQLTLLITTKLLESQFFQDQYTVGIPENGQVDQM